MLVEARARRRHARRRPAEPVALAALDHRRGLARQRVVVVITGEGLKTLDAVRGTFEAYEIAPSYDEFTATVEAAEVRA